MSEPLVVDIGAAMKTLEANPELGRMMNELVLGPFVAQQLAANDAEIARLREALAALVEDLEMRSKNGVVDCSDGVYSAARAALKETAA